MILTSSQPRHEFKRLLFRVVFVESLRGARQRHQHGAKARQAHSTLKCSSLKIVKETEKKWSWMSQTDDVWTRGRTPRHTRHKSYWWSLASTFPSRILVQAFCCDWHFFRKFIFGPSLEWKFIALSIPRPILHVCQFLCSQCNAQDIYFKIQQPLKITSAPSSDLELYQLEDWSP